MLPDFEQWTRIARQLSYAKTPYGPEIGTDEWTTGCDWRVRLRESEADAENARSLSVLAGVDLRLR
jgi:hypothetical protein